MPNGAAATIDSSRWTGAARHDPATPPPPELLLRSSGGERAVPPLVPGDLVRDASAIVLALCAGRRPGSWSGTRFVREVALVRAHLEPIRDARLLGVSYGREAFQSLPVSPRQVARATPVRVAYAMRWAELATGLRLPPLPAWLDADVPAG
ncbi:MAG: hypothetical protein AB1627_15950 [Chloroflexota bacterium]